jgi:hypothetical protein
MRLQGLLSFPLTPFTGDDKVDLAVFAEHVERQIAAAPSALFVACGTGEFTALKIPDSINAEYGGHYYEWEVYGTVNFTKNLGAQLGWRAHDLAYLAKLDSGSAKLGGFYFGGTARF